MRNRAILITLASLMLANPIRGADAFDRHTNPVLAAAPRADGVIELKKLSSDTILDHDRAVPDASAALVVVKTRGGRWSKLLVRIARQRIEKRTIPILVIERFVTYKEGEEQTVVAAGKDVHLFDGFRFDLDIGQVVPQDIGGDILFNAKEGRGTVEPLGLSKLYLITKPLRGAEPKKSTKPVIGERFEKRYFNGTYRLHDDGRRSGKITLKVDEGGSVSGAYYSDKDGSKYDVVGRIVTPDHAIQFTIKFPRTEQSFQGWLFTGDGKAITGSSRLQDREAGFYAVRVEDE